MAATECDFANFVSDFLEIIESVGNKADKLRVQGIVRRSIRFILKRMDLDVKAINLAISNTQKQAIVTSGGKLKEDLREIRDRLSSLL